MRKIAENIIIVLMLISLMGCSLPTAPANLIKAPLEDEADIELKKVVAEFLPPNARLTIPISVEGNNKAILIHDITGDGKEEIIAFFKTADFGLGFLILALDEKNQWRQLSLMEQFGEEVALVEIIDISGDEKPELLVGFSSGSSLDNQLFIYSCSANELKELANFAYSTFTLGDIDGDKLPELVISKNERRNDIPTALIEVYKYRNKHLDLIHTTEYEGYPGELLIGKANHDTVGLFVEVYLGAHSAASHLLVYRNGKLIPALTENLEIDDISFKPYPLPSKDVNGDGIIEIGVHRAPPGSDDLAMVEIPWIENWYKWNGETGLVWVGEVYADYGYGYEWLIPAVWRDEYTLIRTNSEESSLVEFYDLTDHGHDLFTLLSIEGDLWAGEKEGLEGEGRTYEVLAERELLNKVYVAVLPEAKTCRCFLPIRITMDEIKENFALLDVDL